MNMSYNHTSFPVKGPSTLQLSGRSMPDSINNCMATVATSHKLRFVTGHKTKSINAKSCEFIGFEHESTHHQNHEMRKTFLDIKWSLCGGVCWPRRILLVRSQRWLMMQAIHCWARSYLIQNCYYLLSRVVSVGLRNCSLIKSKDEV
jgi:hypothetical protein